MGRLVRSFHNRDDHLVDGILTLLLRHTADGGQLRQSVSNPVLAIPISVCVLDGGFGAGDSVLRFADSIRSSSDGNELREGSTLLGVPAQFDLELKLAAETRHVQEAPGVVGEVQGKRGVTVRPDVHRFSPPNGNVDFGGHLLALV